ncbi:MAG: SLC13 family permease, partial [Planctomycetota bacterium]
MFQDQSLQILIAMATILGVVIVLFWRRSVPLEILFGLALALFVLCGVIEPEQAWQGFANGTVIAIGSLLVVTAGLRTSGVLDQVGRWLLGSAKDERSALGRLVFAVLGGSAFLLNTAIVAMLLPQIVNWCRARNVAPSRLLLPISYMAILGGTCTLVGTSTNLLVNENLQQLQQELQLATTENGLELSPESSLSDYNPEWLTKYRSSFAPMQMTDITWVGVP